MPRVKPSAPARMPPAPAEALDSRPAAVPAHDDEAILLLSSDEDVSDEKVAPRPKSDSSKPSSVKPPSLLVSVRPAPADTSSATLHLCRVSLRAELLAAFPKGTHRKATHGPAHLRELEAAAPGDGPSLLIWVPPLKGNTLSGPPHLYVSVPKPEASAASSRKITLKLKFKGQSESIAPALGTGPRTFYHAPLADALPVVPGQPAGELAAAFTRLANAGLLLTRVSATTRDTLPVSDKEADGLTEFAPGADFDAELSSFAASLASDIVRGSPTKAPRPLDPVPVLVSLLVDIYLPLSLALSFTPAKPYALAPASKEPAKSLGILLRWRAALSARQPSHGTPEAHDAGDAASASAASTGPASAEASAIVCAALIPGPSLEGPTPEDGDDRQHSHPQGSHAHRLHAPVGEEDVYAAATPLLHEEGAQAPLDLTAPSLSRLATVLRPTLRGYQSRGVAWMRGREAAVDARVCGGGAEPEGPCLVSGEGILYRSVPIPSVPRNAVVLSNLDDYDDDEDGEGEGEGNGVGDKDGGHRVSTAPLHPMWAQCRDLDGRIFYACPYSGQISLAPVGPFNALTGAPAVSLPDTVILGSAAPRLPLAAGTLYADPMGLGKTVSVLALVLATDPDQAGAVSSRLRLCTPLRDSEERLRLMGDLRCGRPATADDIGAVALAAPAAPPIAAAPKAASNVHLDFDDEEGDGDEDGTDDDVVVNARARPVATPAVKQAGGAPASSKQGPKGSVDSDDPLPGPGDAPSDPSSTACICGAPYAVPLDPSVQAAMRAGFDAIMVDGRPVAIRKDERADALPWVPCAVCHRWQHALCGAYSKDDADAGAPFYCVECRCASLAGRPLPSATTLIVTPTTILSQWQAEIVKHTRTDSPQALRVVYYQGVKPTLGALARAAQRMDRLLASLEAVQGKKRPTAAAAASSVPRPKPSASRGASTPSATDTAPPLAASSVGEGAPSGIKLRLRLGTSAAGEAIATPTAPMPQQLLPPSAYDDSRDGDTDDEDDEDAGFAPASASGHRVSGRKRPRVSYAFVDEGEDDDSEVQILGDDDEDDDNGPIKLQAMPRFTMTQRETRATELRVQIAELTAETHALARTLLPDTLAAADIVITTYDALKGDIDHAENQTAEFLAFARTLRSGSAAATATTPGAPGKGASAGAEPPASSPNAMLASRLASFFAPRKLSLFDTSSSHAGASGGRSMRGSKKYRVSPTPLLAVWFYRAALDETQLIASPSRDAAVVARQLWTWHRCCVSGTPLARGIDDLRGLLLFLGVPVYDDEKVFNRCLLEPAQAGDVPSRTALLRLAHSLMWRSRMDRVGHELDIPPCTRETIRLSFSRIEEAHYRMQFSRLAEKVAPVLAQWRKEEADRRRRSRTVAASGAGASASSAAADIVDTEPGDTPAAAASAAAPPDTSSSRSLLLGHLSLTKREADRLLGPLLRLRQSAVHPQIGGGGLRKGGATRGAGGGGFGGHHPQGGRALGGGGLGGSIKPLSELLQDMIGKSVLDAEEAQRTIVFSLNGIAGLRWLQGDLPAAGACYRAVIDMAAAADRAAASAQPAAGTGATGALSGIGATSSSSSSDLTVTASGAPVVRVDRLPQVHAIRNYLALLEEAAREKRADGDGLEGDNAVVLAPAPEDRTALERKAAALEDYTVGSAGVTVIKEFGPLEKRAEALLEVAKLRIAGPQSQPVASSASSSPALMVIDDGASAESVPDGSVASFRAGLALSQSRLGAVYAALASTNHPLVETLRVVANHVLNLVAPPLVPPPGVGAAGAQFSHLGGGAAGLPSVASQREIEAVLNAARGTSVMSPWEREAMLAAAAMAGEASVGRAVAWGAGSLVTVRAKLLHALSQLEAARGRALAAMAIALQPTEADIRANANCKQCREVLKRSGDLCASCRVKGALEDYQAHLVGFKRASLADDGKARQRPTGAEAAASRSERRKKRSAPGADGQLSSFLVANMQDAAAAAADEEDEEEEGKLGKGRDLSVPTACARVLIALARAAAASPGGVEVDVAEVLAGTIREGAGAGAHKKAAPAGAGAGSSHSTTDDLYFHRASLPPPARVAPSFDPGHAHPPTVVVRPGEWIPRVLESLTSEVKEMFAAWQAQADLLSSIDELRMARDVRAELVPDSEKIPDSESSYRFKAFELPSRIAEHEGTRAGGEADLRKHLAYLRYLLNIRKEEARDQGQGQGQLTKQPGVKSGAATGIVRLGASTQAAASAGDAACPVCLNRLSNGKGGSYFAIAGCMHRLCSPCARRIVANAKVRDQVYGLSSAKCPTCRATFTEGDLLKVGGQTAPPATATTAAGQAVAAMPATAAPEVPTEPVSASSSEEAASALSPSAPLVPPQPGTLAFLYSGLHGRRLARALGVKHPSPGSTSASAAGSSSSAMSVDDGSGESSVDDFADEDEAHAIAQAAVAVAGSYGTKIEALVKCLRALQQQRRAGLLPGDSAGSNVGSSRTSTSRPLQALVFSQWDDALSIAHSALSRNGIGCLRLAGARKAGEVVSRFIAQPAAYTVLLMPLRPGFAEGLNLTCATHVFLLEPSLEPAVVRQAIGRVHRMGQASPTFVHEFVLRGSIEETVAALAASRQQTSSALTASLQIAAPVDDAPRRRRHRGSAQAVLAMGTSQPRSDSDTQLAALAAAQVSLHRSRAVPGRPEADGDSDDGLDGAGAAGHRAHAPGGRDDGGLVRRDVVRLFESEQAFARELQEALDGASQKDARAHAAATTAAAARRDAAALEAGEDEDDAASSAAAAKELAAAAAELRASATRNNRFWNNRVIHNGRPTVRLMALSQLSAVAALSGQKPQRDDTAAAGAAPVQVFGRSVLRAVAVSLLSLPSELPAMSATQFVRAAGGLPPDAPDDKVAKAVAVEERLRATLDEAIGRLRSELADVTHHK